MNNRQSTIAIIVISGVITLLTGMSLMLTMTMASTPPDESAYLSFILPLSILTFAVTRL